MPTIVVILNFIKLGKNCLANYKTEPASLPPMPMNTVITKFCKLTNFGQQKLLALYRGKRK